MCIKLLLLLLLIEYIQWTNNISPHIKSCVTFRFIKIYGFSLYTSSRYMGFYFASLSVKSRVGFHGGTVRDFTAPRHAYTGMSWLLRAIPSTRLNQ